MPAYRRVVCAVLAAGASGTVIAQGLYRCQAGGETVYRDTPCASDQRRVLSEADKREIARADAEDARKAAERRSREAEERVERQAQEDARKACGSLYGKWPQVGQPARLVLACVGEPDKRNVTTTRNGTQEQWVYTHHGYVYIDERGVVTGTQQRR